jgi:predicted pyridoxine 5'-phosphate oxidase superfamily flavin-nucleotide-binding protein
MGILTEEMQRLVREQRLGFVATVSPSGSPNVSPKGSLSILDDDHLVFADVESPNTVENLSRNPETEINVVDPFSRRGFRFRGTCTVAHSGTTYWKVLEMYRDEGSDIRRIRSVVLVKVEHVAPLISPVYTLDVTEEEIRSRWEEYHTKKGQLSIVDLVPPRDF